jgi:hypothetical protein
MLIGWLIGGPDSESRRVFGDLHRHAQRDCRAVCGALLLSGHQRLHDSDCLSFADGAHEPAIPSRVHWMVQNASSGGGEAI